MLARVGDELCWWHVWDVGDRWRYQHQELSTNIKKQSSTSHSGSVWCNVGDVKWSPRWSHQHNDVTNITVTSSWISKIPFNSIKTRKKPSWLMRTIEFLNLNWLKNNGYVIINSPYSKRMWGCVRNPKFGWIIMRLIFAKFIVWSGFCCGNTLF